MSAPVSSLAAAAASTSENTTQFLRAIAAEITAKILPELKSADAIERANFARLVLLNLAADLDVLPGLAARLLPGLARALGDAAAGSGDPVLQQFAADAVGARADAAVPKQLEVAALRDAAARAVRQLADAGGEADFGRLAALGRWDAGWVIDYDAACAAGSGAAAGGAGGAGPAAAETVTAANVTAYLRRVFPEAPGIAATEVIPIPGGRSKKTFFVTLSAAGPLPRELVIRQDYALKYAGTKIVDEYGPLSTLAQRGLPVPKPLHLEREPSELGPPFMFVNRLSGKPPGTYFSTAVPCPGAFRELATMLARLHQVAPESLGFAAPAAGTDSLLGLIEQYRRKWRDNATRSSPVVDYAYAWAARECARSPGSSAFVHGDAGPYNLLVEDDRLRAILDWEFGHVGDPAEDLGVARIYAESCMPWAEFMDVYLRAGGRPVSEERIRLGMLTQFLKGTTLVAASGRNFKEGGTSEFIKGANAFTGLRLIELRIAQLLRRFGAA